MLLTEEEAKTRWCPFAEAGQYLHPETAVPVSMSEADDTNQLRGNKCIGAACMMWRWVTEPMFTDADKEFVQGGTPHAIQSGTWRGHCGLAGPCAR